MTWLAGIIGLVLGWLWGASTGYFDRLRIRVLVGRMENHDAVVRHSNILSRFLDKETALGMHGSEEDLEDTRTAIRFFAGRAISRDHWESIEEEQGG